MSAMIFSVKDMVAERFMEPFFAVNEASAMRSFQMECGREGTQFNQYPEDFVLYCLGLWDPEKGEIVGQDARKIVNASAFAQEQEPTGAEVLDRQDREIKERFA